MLEPLEPKYPYIQTVDSGYKVHINKRVSLPGYYLTYVRAQQAITAYNNKPKATGKTK